MIGGSGEQRTLRLVARFGDACNLWPTPEIPHKLEVLRAHCEAAGRDYDSIEKTAMFHFDLGEKGEKVDEVIGRLHWLAGMGIENVIGGVRDVSTIRPLEILGERVIPAVAKLEPKAARATA
jgi:alkanesulfonate monooxygenase SsuD/methylene tetrahydromethanopterin reductase-like flavin-dependent oxidoreductase (luciferase family)